MASARFWLLKTKSKQTKDGLCPVKLIVSHDDRRKRYSLKERLYPESRYLSTEAWEKVMSNKPQGQYRTIRQDLDDRLREAQNAIHKIVEQYGEFSFDRFEREFLNRNFDWKDVYHAFETHIDDLRKDGRYGTADTFELAYKSIKKYRKEKRLSFHDITPSWLQGYEQWMLKRGRSAATVGIYMRHLRTLFNIARDTYGVKAEYPFKKYKPATAKAHKRALSPKDIAAIMKYDPGDSQGKAFARDMFLFSFFCSGANIGDIARLRYRDIEGSEIVFSRQKTKNSREKTTIRVPFIQSLQDIVDRWGRKTINQDTYIFPMLDGGMSEARKKEVIMNKRSNLRKRLIGIAKEIGLEHLSLIHARHSYATITKNSGASTEFIQEQLGHSSPNVTQNYLDSFTEEARKEKAQELEDLITKSETG